MKRLLAILASIAMLSAQCVEPSYNVLVVAHGDSITYGQGTGVSEWYLIRLTTLITTSVRTPTAVNAGTPGISYNYAWSGWPDNPNTMIQEGAAVIDSHLSDAGYKTKWLIVFAGTNGMNLFLANHSAEVEFANFEQYMAARRLAGWDMSNTVVCTMLPRGAGEEARRTAFNGYLVAGASYWKYKLARFDLDPNMGQAGQNDDPVYYSDGVHPTDAGHAILAAILNQVMYTDAGSSTVSCGNGALRGSVNARRLTKR